MNYNDLSTERKKQVLIECAQDILKNFNTATMRDTEEIYTYQAGVYLQNGETYLKEFIHRFFGGTENDSIVREILGKIRRSTFTERKTFDTNPDEICVMNGILNVKTRELSPHNPKKYFLTKIPVYYHPESDCPRITQFLDDVACSDEDTVRTLEEIAGWLLLTKRYSPHKAVVLLGVGRNGKSTYLGLLTNFIGKHNCSSTELGEFGNSRFATSNLFSKLANICTELNDKIIRHTAIFKSLTGEDLITAEYKMMPSFNFTNKAKMIFAANKLPKVYEDTTAFWSRWIIVPFKNSFKETDAKTDPDMLSKLSTHEELSGLLNLALNGLQRLEENKAFTVTKSIEETRQLYLRNSMPILSFIDERLEAGSTVNFTSRTEMYALYSDYCVRNQIALPTQNKFTRDFRKTAEQYTAIDVEACEGSGSSMVRGYRNVKPKIMFQPGF